MSEKEWRSAAEETLGANGLVDVDDVELRRDFSSRLTGSPVDDPQHLVPAPLQLLGDALDELVDRVLGAPPDGRDLGYRERLGRARVQHKSPPRRAL